MLSGRQKNIPKHQNTLNKYAFLTYVKYKLWKRCSSRASSVHSRKTASPECCECYYIAGGFCWLHWFKAFVHMLTCLTQLAAAINDQDTIQNMPDKQKRAENFTSLCLSKNRRDDMNELWLTITPRGPRSGGPDAELLWRTSVPSFPASSHQLMSYDDLYLFCF